jgi:hypothetical protein
MRPVYVRGCGLWTPGFPDAASWCRGIAEPALRSAPGRLLAGPLHRRASALTRMAADALEEAAREARCDLAGVPSVWATVFGEHETAVAILEAMHQGEGKVSPTRFHNSVHNAASGYVSIAAGSRAPSTTVTGGREVVASALFEAQCMLAAGAPEVLLVLADEPLLPPFDAQGGRAPLALAFALAAAPRGALAALSGLRRDRVAPVKRDERFGGLLVSAGLPLLEYVALRRPGCVALELEGEPAMDVWCVDVELVAASGSPLPPPGGDRE